MEELQRVGGRSGPGGKSFVELRSLMKSQAPASKRATGKLSCREVEAALLQAGTESRGGQKEAPSPSPKAGAKEQASKNAGVLGENRGFSVTQFLVGSGEYGDSIATEGESEAQTESAAVALGVEELLGWASAWAPARPGPKGVRKPAEMLVENRFRCVMVVVHG